MASKPRPSRLVARVAISTAGERAEAFVPPPLPPEPPVRMGKLYRLLEEASRAIGRLDGVTSILPDTPLFLYMYIRKEALLSSQIEGTQPSLSDLLLFETEEAPGAPLDDVQEVSNYVAAVNHGLARKMGVRTQAFPALLACSSGRVCPGHVSLGKRFPRSAE